MFWQKLISNQKLNFQEKKWILSGLTFFNDNNGKPFIPHVVFRTLHFFRVYWKTLQTLGSTWRGRASRRYIFGIVCFVLSSALLLFHVRNLAANSIRMIFWYIILMRHSCPFDVHQTWAWPSYLVFLGASAPLYPPTPVCKRRELHGTIGFEVSQGGYSSVRELVRILNAPNLRFQSPGWFFTFSFPWRFKLTTLAFSISRMIFWTLGR